MDLGPRITVALGLACAVVFVAGVFAAITVAPGDVSAIEDVRAIGGAERAGGTSAPGELVPALPGAVDGRPAQPSGAAPGIDTRRSASAVEVQARAWPERATTDGPWAAAIQGGGDRLVVVAPGVVVDGLSLASVSVEPADGPGETRTNALVLPDGAQWAPQGPFSLDGEGDLPFSDKSLPQRPAPPFTSTPEGTSVAETTLTEILEVARGPITTTGTFTGPDGASSSRLELPAGSRLASVCLPGADPEICQTSTSIHRLALPDRRDGPGRDRQG